MPQVRELMTPEPVKVPATTPIVQCARILWRLGVRHLPVVDVDGRFAGVVSDFDVLQQGEIISDDGTWLDRGTGGADAGSLARTLALECRPDDDLLQLLADMRDQQRDVAVVVDNRRHPVGILTEHDAVRWARAFLGVAPTLVHPGSPVHKVDAMDPGFAAFDRMVENGVRHLLVYEDDAPVGVLSWRDLVVEDLLDWRQAKVGDLLRSDSLVTAREGTTLRQIANLMVRLRIGCIPLTSADDEVVGVVTRSDVIGAVIGRLPTDLADR